MKYEQDEVESVGRVKREPSSQFLDNIIWLHVCLKLRCKLLQKSPRVIWPLYTDMLNLSFYQIDKDFYEGIRAGKLIVNGNFERKIFNHNMPLVTSNQFVQTYKNWKIIHSKILFFL